MAHLSDGAPGEVTSPALDADPLDGRGAGRMLVRGGALRFGGFAGGVGLSVLSAAVLTRYLGASRFGQYTTITSLVAVIAAVTDAGMSNLGTREYAILREPARTEMMRSLLGLRVSLTLAGVAIVAAFGLAAGYDAPLLLGGIVACLATVALVFQHTLSIPLATDLRLGVLSGLELLRQALTTGGLVLLAVLGVDVLGLLSVPMVANLALIAPTAALVRGRVRARPALRATSWLPLLRASIVFSLATAVGTIYVYTAQILTSLVTTHHQSGLFAVSFRVFIVSASVPGLLIGATLPVLARAARDDRERLAHVLQRIFEVSLIAGVGSALTLAAGSGFVISVIGGPRYAAASPVLEIQSTAIVASFLVAVWSFGLLSLHLHRRLLAANLAALVVSIALTLVLARADGAHGAAIATICGETTLAAANLMALARHDRSYRPRVTGALKVAAVTALAAACCFGPPMPSVARAVVAVSVYAAGIVITRALPAELAELLPARLRPR